MKTIPTHLWGVPDPGKENPEVNSIINGLNSVQQLISGSQVSLRNPPVKPADIKDAFDKLTNAEDTLWRLRDQMEAAGVEYLMMRQIDDLLSDLNSPFTVPQIQLDLRILIQSGTPLTSPEAQEKIRNAHTGLNKLRSDLGSLSRNLSQRYALNQSNSPSEEEG